MPLERYSVSCNSAAVLCLSDRAFSDLAHNEKQRTMSCIAIGTLPDVALIIGCLVAGSLAFGNTKVQHELLNHRGASNNNSYTVIEVQLEFTLPCPNACSRPSRLCCASSNMPATKATFRTAKLLSMRCTRLRTAILTWRLSVSCCGAWTMLSDRACCSCS